MGLVIWRKSRVPVIAKMGISGIDSTCGSINSGAHSKNGPGIDSTHGIGRPLMYSTNEEDGGALVSAASVVGCLAAYVLLYAVEAITSEYRSSVLVVCFLMGGYVGYYPNDKRLTGY
jgi:hypothetical protein